MDHDDEGRRGVHSACRRRTKNLTRVCEDVVRIADQLRRGGTAPTDAGAILAHARLELRKKDQEEDSPQGVIFSGRELEIRNAVERLWNAVALFPWDTEVEAEAGPELRALFALFGFARRETSDNPAPVAPPVTS